MKVKYNGHTLIMYDSIQDLPITRFQSFNLNVLIDGGIGSDLNGFIEKRNRISELMGVDIEAARLELSNFEQLIRFVITNNSPQMNSFVCLIRSINGRDLTEQDVSESGIKEIIKQLGAQRFSIRKLGEVLGLLKKKIEEEFDEFFPEISNDITVKEFYSKLKSRVLLGLEKIITGSEKVDSKIEELDEFFISSFKPKIYYGHTGMEVQFLKRFQDTCSALELNNLSTNPLKLSTLAFYQKVELLRNMIKAQNKRGGGLNKKTIGNTEPRVKQY